ncbi:chromate transporter [Candidatus Mycoplasma pogonae]
MKKANFWNVLIFIFKCTFIGFGGGNALMPIINKYAVEKNQWITKEEFEKAFVLVNLLPGPSVVQMLSLISMKVLGKWIGLLATLIGLLPNLGFFLVIFIGINFLPKPYLLIINVTVMSSIIGIIVVFGYQYLKKTNKELNLVAWVLLFIFSFIFILFAPSPMNIASAPLLIVILTLIIFGFIKKRQQRGK